MYYFLVPLIVGVTIQAIKITIDFFQEKKLYISNIRRAGGFPSVHGGVSSSIATLMFLHFGIDSAEFAIAFSFAILFWYDSMNIRYEAGKHAKYLNTISSQLSSVLEFGDNKYIVLKERLGHTFLEVAGGIITGILLTMLFYHFLY